MSSFYHMWFRIHYLPWKKLYAWEINTHDIDRNLMPLIQLIDSGCILVLKIFFVFVITEKLTKICFICSDAIWPSNCKPSSNKVPVAARRPKITKTRLMIQSAGSTGSHQNWINIFPLPLFFIFLLFISKTWEKQVKNVSNNNELNKIKFKMMDLEIQMKRHTYI